ncbi:MAG TPA: hypothetical protein VFI08_07285 [Spirochaetia bacterium]|nr:hypothetical protein [Spirochaetia bacterium]
MGRAIEQENSFLQVLLKLIPSEVIAVFVFVQGVLPGTFWPHLVLAVVLIGLTPLYLYYAQGVKARSQLVLSTLSLVVWIYAMGTGPLRFVKPPYYEPWHGAVVLAVWTLVPPMLLTQHPATRIARSPSRPAKTAAKKTTPRKAAPRKKSSPG